MKTTELKAYPRTDLGKSVTRQMRREGKVPGVVYDNSNAIHIVLDYRAVKPTLFTKDTYIVKLDLDGQTHDTIIREAQYHPVTEKILHVDFLKVSDDKEVILTLPIKLEGNPRGVLQGGKLISKLRKIKVKGIPSQLPEFVEVDVSDLKLGTTIKVGEAKIEGLNVITSPSAAIASVEIPRALKSAGASDEMGEDEEGEAEGGDSGEEAAE